MPCTPKYTTQQVITALKSCRGLVYLAAQKLQCHPQTIINYCNKHPTVAAARDDARGEILDTAEAKLFLAVQRGEPWAVTFCLRTVGKSRGYAEQVDVRLTIEAAAARVAAACGLTTREVLAEAQLLLTEGAYADAE